MNTTSIPAWKTGNIQPVHNAYLLIISELGIVGFVIFLLFLISLFFRKKSMEKREGNLYLTYNVLYVILLSFLMISFFDHYFWDIKQGMIIFVLPLIILHIKIKEDN